MTMFATSGYDGPYSMFGYVPGRPDSEHPVKIWNAKTGELVATLKGHTSSVYCLAWTLNRKTLISGSTDSSIRIWDTTNWKQIAVLDGHDEVHAIAISRNGRILASALWDKTARLWNLDNNQPIMSPPLHHANCVSFSADGKLLATGSWDKNAYVWDVSAILKEAGLDDLLLDQRDKLLLATDATRRPVRQPIKVSPRVPRGFFDDIPNHAHLSAQHRSPSQIPSPSYRSTLRSRFLSFFRPIHHDVHHMPSRPRPFQWVRNRLFARPSRADIELHEHPSAVVDVPLCQAKRRNASARERRRPIPKPIRTNAATAGASRPPNSTLTQQSNSTAQAQSLSQPHAAVSSAPPVVGGNTTSSTAPHVTIKYPARWTRFWLFICCASPEYTDGHPGTTSPSQ